MPARCLLFGRRFFGAYRGATRGRFTGDFGALLSRELSHSRFAARFTAFSTHSGVSQAKSLVLLRHAPSD